MSICKISSLTKSGKIADICLKLIENHENFSTEINYTSIIDVKKTFQQEKATYNAFFDGPISPNLKIILIAGCKLFITNKSFLQFPLLHVFKIRFTQKWLKGVCWKEITMTQDVN